MNSSEVGYSLRQAREARALTLEQVSEALHIKPRYLQALEEGRWEALPSPAQGRGFLRLYAAFLGLDPQPLLQGMAQDGPAEEGAAGEDEVAPSPATAPSAEPSVVPPQAEAATAEEEDPAAAIFVELGRLLREQRERLGLSLEEVERHTHVRVPRLRAMEEGRFDDLPSPVQARGMLLHYARFLQLDPDPLLLRFADALQSRYQARQATQPRPRSPFRFRRWPRITLRLPERALAAALVAFTAVFLLWGGWQVFRTGRAQTQPPTPPSVLEVLFPTASPTPTLAPLTPTATPGAALPLAQEPQGTGTPEAPPQPGGQTPIQVYVVVRQRAYLRVTVDDEERLAQRVLPGSTYFFGGNARVELSTGNGAAIQVYYNQQDLGLLGRFGEAVTRIFTLNGVLTPTPLPSPTPTATRPATPTPTPTATPTVTATPTSPPASP